MKTWLIFISWCFLTAFNECDKQNNTLKLLHVVFRHGDRTPIRTPSVFQINKTQEKYYPYGIAQLTNRGKQRAYNLGKWLRQRHDSFLNRTFTIKELSAITTNTGRTKSSLALVLTGIYPPKGTLLEWNTKLNWNPINYNVLPTGHPLLHIPQPNCKQFMKLFQSYTNSDAGQKTMEKYNLIAEYLAQYTNVSFNSTLDYYAMYDTYTVQKEFGLELPEWIEKVLPILGATALTDFARASMATKELKQLVIGHLIQKIINDTTSKLNKVSKFKSKKLFMYSSHDFIVSNLLLLINPYINFERPPYSACVLLEIHNINNVNGVKVFYLSDVNSNIYSVPIDNCGIFCPLDQFISIYKEYFPVNTDC